MHRAMRKKRNAWLLIDLFTCLYPGSGPFPPIAPVQPYVELRSVSGRGIGKSNQKTRLKKPPAVLYLIP